MLSLVASVAFGLAGACLIAAAARTLGEPVRLRPLAGALLLLVLYWAVVVLGASLQGLIPALEALKWNWTGKVVSVAATLGVTLVLLRRAPEEAGLRLRQAPGSLGPALVCVALLCALAWTGEALEHDGRNLSVERLLFQGLMPGLDEELFFRGLFLAVLARAFQERWRFAGAPLGPAAAIATLIFASGHGVGLGPDGLRIDAGAFLMTGALGFGLLWIRQRTGSLLLPVLAHNLINVGNSFF